MADGSVLRGLRRVVKDNMGYDLRHLLIGAEGTLGLITAASLRLFPQPDETATAWVSVASPMAALELLQELRGALGATISAFELMHVEGLGFLAEVMPAVPVPPRMASDWVVLVETADAVGGETRARLEAALGRALDSGLAGDALVAQGEAQRAVFWGVRESIPEANRLIGSISSHDIALPSSRLAEFIARAGPAVAALGPELRINCFGHLGDGNLHYNVFPPRGQDRDRYESLREAVKRTVHDLVHELGGSVGAEHGVGRLKAGDLVRYGDPGALAAARAIKAALDPLGILNPGAVLT
jgi:FAD/FMN-containing dehydrogenase